MGKENAHVNKNEEKFLSFIKERESIRIRRLLGAPWPWTKDKILQEYKFTNVHRIYDKTTQSFLKLYKEHEDSHPSVKLFQCAVNRWFGTVDFVNAVGWLGQADSMAIRRVLYIAKKLIGEDVKIFTGAYMITNGNKSGPKEELVVRKVLTPLSKHLDKIVQEYDTNQTWESMYRYMKDNLFGFGGSGFMVKEVLQDALLMTPFSKAKDRGTWTPVGPGARRGLNRMHKRAYDDRLNEELAIEECINLWCQVMDPWWEWACMNNAKYELKKAPVLELTAHDVQFQLCEWDKWMRVKLGQGRPRSRYRRES